MIIVNHGKRSWMSAVVVVAIGASVVAGAGSLRGQSRLITADPLAIEMGFSDADVRAADSGSAVIQSLDTSVREEVAYVAMVSIDAPVERFIERFRDIEQFERGPGTPLIGRFSDPPQLDDLAALRLPVEDVAALENCRPGKCDVKLSAATMQRFQDGVDWSRPDTIAQAEQVAREMILDLVRAYQLEGNAALGTYDDGDDPMSVAGQVHDLLASLGTLPTPVPELIAYLDAYPDGRPVGVEDFFYWALVDFGLKRTVRVNHVTIYRLEPMGASRVAYVIATKQLYASHYFYSTLELRFLVDVDRSPGLPGTSLISITRSRNDGMTGFKGIFVRPIIRGRSSKAVRGYMDHVKRQVERPLEAAP
jgi:hypothetical protein